MLHYESKRRGASLKPLLLGFCAWKLLLLCLAAFCPGPGYDTSSLILFDPKIDRHDGLNRASRLKGLALNLVRWDAVYFVQAADRGYIFEQEWAFSRTFSQLLGHVGHYVAGDAKPTLLSYVVAGVVISNVCHLLSVLVLFHLVLHIVSEHTARNRIAFLASVLHICTPASLFLSTAYTEALFSFLNLTGMLCYVLSKNTAQVQGSNLQEDLFKLGSGLAFALATTIRSNGLLSGLILLYDVVQCSAQVFLKKRRMHGLRRIVIGCMAGLLVALGFVGPQYIGYLEFCEQPESLFYRPWCRNLIPSVYSWVQAHYWNVGLFRYWSFSNVPLFFMALPAIWLMLESGAMTLHGHLRPSLRKFLVLQSSDTMEPTSTPPVAHQYPELVVPQMVLAIATTTNFHVQIINRIASGYPTWYITIAIWLISDTSPSATREGTLRNQWIIRGMISYALVQGMLFANFLPPA